MVKKRLTKSLEDYIEAIYAMLQVKQVVRVTDLAEEFSYSKASISRAISTLKTKGLVKHEAYGTITLTQKGITLAKAVMDKHIMLTNFLVDILGVSSSVAEEDACKIEHIVSQETVDKIKEYMKKS
jgi:DtxR family transcriptional regulator, Mn-dependent transcriptional regulator